jgi:hypothetical protein
MYRGKQVLKVIKIIPCFPISREEEQKEASALYLYICEGELILKEIFP